MLHTITQKLLAKRHVESVFAHCDIPCKIYDPATAQIAVLTMIRMIDLINELEAKGSLTIKDQSQLIRLVNEKEAQGLKVKEEVRVIWGDYFKQPQFDQVPNIHELVHRIMLQASKVKQGVERVDALALLALVNEFTEAFWLTKGVTTYKAIAPYLPSEAVVYPKLDAV